MTDLQKTVEPTEVPSQPASDRAGAPIDDVASWPTADAVNQPITVSPEPVGAPPPAPDLSINRGALGALKAGQVDVSVGAIGAARADRISVQFGSIGGAAAREIQVSTGGVGGVLAQSVKLEQAFARSIIAQRVTLGRGAGAGIVLAARVDGDGRPLLDWRGGLAAGAVFALVWLVVRRLR